MNLIKSIAIAATVVTALTTTALAESYKVGDLTIDGTWARPSVGTKGNSAAYMTITNHGGTADTLIAVSTPGAGKVELHTHIKDKDIMRMRRVEGGIPVPQNGMVALKPGGYHVMLMKLKEPIKKGAMLPLTLTFKNAGNITIQANVQMSKGMKGHMHHGKGKMEQKQKQMHKHN